MSDEEDEGRHNCGVLTRVQTKINKKCSLDIVDEDQQQEESSDLESKFSTSGLKMSEMNKLSLQQIIETLSLKTKEHAINQRSQNELNITAESLSQIVPNFDGGTIPVEQRFLNIEQSADAYELREKQKYGQARGKMLIIAKLFTKSVLNSNAH